MKKIFNILQNYIRGMVNMVKGLPPIVAIIVVLAIVILPDPLIILCTVVMKKIGVVC